MIEIINDLETLLAKGGREFRKKLPPFFVFTN